MSILSAIPAAIRDAGRFAVRSVEAVSKLRFRPSIILKGEKYIGQNLKNRTLVFSGPPPDVAALDAAFRLHIDYADRAKYLAIYAMQDRAEEGIAAAANWTARKTRTNLIDAIAQHTALPRGYIERVIHIAQEADESDPRAIVRIDHEPVPLGDFPSRQTGRGIAVTTDPNGNGRFVANGFYGGNGLSAGIYQRAYRGGDQVGRLPIKELEGPSVLSTLQTTPGLLDQQLGIAGQELRDAVFRARDIVVYESMYDDSPPLLTGDDPRMEPGRNNQSAIQDSFVQFGWMEKLDIAIFS